MSTIKISELATNAISLTDFFAKADASGVASKNDIQGLSNFLNTVGTLAFRGVLLAADAAVTEDGIYVAGDAGTYANNGGLVITISDQIVLISITGTQTVFEKVEIPISIVKDETPTEGSTNTVESGGIFDYVAKLPKNYSIFKTGVASYDKETFKFSVNDSVYISNSLGGLFLIEGGSGTGLITDFVVAATSSVHLIFVDIPLTSATVTIQSALFNSMPVVPVNHYRYVLGSAGTGVDNTLIIDGLYDENSANVDALNSNVYGSVFGSDSLMNSSVTNWVLQVGTPAFDVNTTIVDKMYLPFTTGNQSIKLDNVLTIGETYLVDVKIKLESGTATILTFGEFLASDVAGNKKIIPTSTEINYTFEIIASTTFFAIGCVTADNNGSTYSIDNIKVRTKEVSTTFNDIDGFISGSELKINTGIITGSNSDFSNSVTDWVLQVGTPLFDVNTTVSNRLYLPFTTGNQSIKLDNVLTVGKKYNVSLKVKLESGTPINLNFGEFLLAQTLGATKILPTATETVYTFEITATTTFFSIGVLSQDNNGSAYSIGDFYIKEVFFDSYELPMLPPKIFNTEQFLTSISRFDKTLTKIAIEGDSLMANQLGGAIPSAEPLTEQPIRLDTNTVSRRIYDLLSWNKPEHRRIDNASFTKSGVWSAVNDTTVWEPAHTNTRYHKSIEASAYVEYAIPDGFENFAIICQKDENFGNINITLNGGSIATYGQSVIDLNRTRGNAGDTGNAYYTEEYTSLPSGVNTIRIAKDANTTEVRVWGIFYWTGNTLMVYNIARGGHSIADLYLQHIEAELKENDFDAVLYQLTLMNDVGDNIASDTSRSYLDLILKTIIPEKDIAFMSTNPMGDNGSGTNYYADNLTPSMEETNTVLAKYLHDKNIPFIDVFRAFKQKILNRDGTLIGGEGGLWYTTDGQHPNDGGVVEWWNIIKFIFNNKPIS